MTRKASAPYVTSVSQLEAHLQLVNLEQAIIDVIQFSRMYRANVKIFISSLACTKSNLAVRRNLSE